MNRLTAVLLATATFAWSQAPVPEIAYDSTPNLLKMPTSLYLGEVPGVAVNSHGHIFVETRTGMSITFAASRVFTHGGSRLFEFAPTGAFVREIGQGLYGFLWGHTVRIDPQDNIWVVDEGSSMVIKFNPVGQVVMTMGRKPESIDVGGSGGGNVAGNGAGVPGDNFHGPQDVAWDAAGNIFVADGTGNSRIAKFDKDGVFLKSWGTKGKEPGQFNGPHAMAVDAQGNVYVADRGNRRIEVFDNNGTFKTQFTNVGRNSAICISSGPHQYLYTSNSNGTNDLDNGEIYRMELDGRIVGKFGHAGKLLKEFSTVHEMDCRNPNEVYVAEPMNWRIQKITLHP